VSSPLDVVVEDGRPLPAENVLALALACDIPQAALDLDAAYPLVPAPSP
jgi:hypothetical protein